MSRSAGNLGAFIFLTLFFLLILVRATLIYTAYTSIKGVSDCPSCMAATAMQQDASLFALIFVLTGCTYFTQRYWLQLPWSLIGIASLGIFAADIAIIRIFSQRLYLFDLIKFNKAFKELMKFINAFLATHPGKFALVLAIACTVLILTLLPRPRRPRLALGCFIVAAALALLGQWRPVTLNYIFAEWLQNVIAVNRNFSLDRPYGNSYIKRITAEYVPPQPVCSPGQARHPNIIILEVESLSMNHSRLFGGEYDLMPHFDAIARNHAWFPNFIANGFTTDGGLIAMITGRPPIPAVTGQRQGADAFAGFADPQGALPDLLHPEGYSVHFFATGNLGFLDQNKWLEALHFDSWEGAESQFYNGWKRYVFDAAEDKALYLRFLQWLDQHTSQQPFLAFLSTLSTHLPFIDPRDDKPSEKGAFQYADEQIGIFYENLKKRGFFQKGILLVLGDHHSMRPLRTAEWKRFGDSALARTPLVLATDLPLARGEITGVFQQTDFVSSLADLVKTQVCRTPAQGVFLRATPIPAAYALHVRGDKRSEIDVFFGSQQAQIVLDGDHSYWKGPKPAEWNTIFNGIMLDRIQRSNIPHP